MMKDHAFAEINVRQLDVVQNGQVTKTRTHINLLQTSEFYSNYLVCRISTHKPFHAEKGETYYSRKESCLAYARIREKKSLLHTSRSQA
nr:hypothetical protein [Tanacetum cinerariifolium]